MKNIIFKSLKLSKELFDNLVSYMENFFYNSELGEGIQVISQGSTYIYCNYILEKIISQDTFNPNTNEFEKVEFKRIEIVPFIVDYEYSTLDIIGNKQKASRVADLIGKMLKYKVAIGDIQVQPIKILSICKSEGLFYTVNRVKIKDYIFFDNIIGECVLNLTDYPHANDILIKYEQQITNFSATIGFEENYIITFYKSGAISIYKDIENMDIGFIRLLKKGL